MANAANQTGWLKAAVITCAIAYALSALAILATTSTPQKADGAQPPQASALAERLLGR